LNAPAESDLSGSAAHAFRDGFEFWAFEQGFRRVGHTDREIGLRAERRECGEGDVLLLAHAEELRLDEERVRFHLMHRRPGCHSIEEITEETRIEVTDPNMLRQTRAIQFLHGRPRFVECDPLEFDSRVGAIGIEEPTWRVALLNRDVFLRDVEMDEIEIDLIESEVLECFFDRGSDVFFRVVSIPKFGGDPQILSSAQAVVDRLANALTDLDFVAVVAREVEVSVSDLDGFVGDPRGVGVFNLPEALSDLGELGARI